MSELTNSTDQPLILYHATDLEGFKRIIISREITGDRLGFGPGLCTTLDRALNFVAIKCGRRARRLGRVFELKVHPSLLTEATPDTVADAFTLDGITSLSLDDPRIIDYEVLVAAHWDDKKRFARRRLRLAREEAREQKKRERTRAQKKLARERARKKEGARRSASRRRLARQPYVRPPDDSRTYRQVFVRCGRPTCKCTRGELHGPYWYAYWSDGGRSRSAYVGKTLPLTTTK
jgi:hypothetical protein